MTTLSEKIVLSVGTGKDPAEITVLDTLDTLTSTAAELNILSGVTANVTMTLPTAATVGEKHRFVYVGGVADAEDWVITSPTLFVGGFAHFDVGGTSAAVYANGSSHAIVTINNPAAGTDITFVANGTNWACTGLVSSADPHAFS